MSAAVSPAPGVVFLGKADFPALNSVTFEGLQFTVYNRAGMVMFDSALDTPPFDPLQQLTDLGAIRRLAEYYAAAHPGCETARDLCRLALLGRYLLGGYRERAAADAALPGRHAPPGKGSAHTHAVQARRKRQRARGLAAIAEVAHVRQCYAALQERFDVLAATTTASEVQGLRDRLSSIRAAAEAALEGDVAGPRRLMELINSPLPWGPGEGPVRGR